MNLKEKLQVIIITYNRKTKLKSTLDEIFKTTSPIKNFDITVLDNASTDGTSELIEKYCKIYPNLKHIRHPKNIGGNANICRAFELGASSSKEYLWVLCDDDKYDFSNWSEVEKLIDQDIDAICVSDYVFPSQKEKNNKAYQIFQLTFVPAGIYKIENITDEVLINMYDSIYTMFQQSCLTIDLINKQKKISVLTKPIVFNGIHFEDKEKDLSFVRGTTEKQISKRRKYTTWVLGFSNILSLLKSKKLARSSMDIAIPYKDIYGYWDNFYFNMCKMLCFFNQINYFFEIFEMLKLKRKKELLLYSLGFFSPISFYKTNKGIYVKLFYILKTRILPISL